MFAGKGVSDTGLLLVGEEVVTKTKTEYRMVMTLSVDDSPS